MTQQNPPPATPPEPVATGRTWSIPLWFALVLMALALILAAVILTRVSGPLYGLVFSRGVPVPDGAEEVEHVRPDKGAEYWIFRTEATGLEVAAYYRDEGGDCVFSANPGGASADEDRAGRVRSVAHCIGQADNAARGSGWEVYIAEGYSPDEGPTVFRLYKY